MHALETRALSFGLINIPIRLYKATEEHEGISFDLLHKKDLSPIRYARVCKSDGQEVSYILCPMQSSEKIQNSG